MKKCPECAEEIQDEAVKCKHCGALVTTPSDEDAQDAEQPESQPPFTKLICNLTVWLGAIIFVIATICLFVQGKVLAGFAGIGFAVLFFFIAPIAWSLGDFFRRFAAPDLYFADGSVDLALKRLFWMVGPQFSAVGILFIVMMALLLGGIAGYH